MCSRCLPCSAPKDYRRRQCSNEAPRVGNGPILPRCSTGCESGHRRSLHLLSLCVWAALQPLRLFTQPHRLRLRPPYLASKCERLEMIWVNAIIPVLSTRFQARMCSSGSPFSSKSCRNSSEAFLPFYLWVKRLWSGRCHRFLRLPWCSTNRARPFLDVRICPFMKRPNSPASMEPDALLSRRSQNACSLRSLREALGT